MTSDLHHPLSRRTLLAGTAGTAGAAPLGALTTAPASAEGPPPGRGVRWKDGRVFPSFSGAGKITVADLRELDGFDRLLLITLQGLVNRDRPEVYVILDDVDETWLPDLPVRARRLEDPFALVEEHRDRITGAVVYDLASPHTVNLATTLAGLRGGVVASAEQAERFSLPILEDLSGRFADVPAAVHDWAMANLWPECTHEILVGLPPTQTVAVDGIEWTELLREPEHVTDSSNLDTYTVDLSGALGTGEVFVRLTDGFTSDGWGPALTGVEVTADGEVIASFVPNTPGEEEFLFDGSGSSTKEGLRFADGGGRMIYRFAVPEGTAALSAALTLENQFVVSATDQAPTRVEPFASFRDFSVATGALVSWLPPSGESGSQFEELLAQVEPGTVYAGWFSNDVAGEWSGVELCSRASVIVVAADFYVNATVLSAMRASTRAKPAAPSQRPVEDRTYLTLTIGEGDNIQYCQRHMRELWDDPGRGAVPMNWTVSPLLEDIGPAILKHFQDTATENDLLVCGPSGAGYTYGDSWPQEDWGVFTRLSGDYQRRTGLDVVYAYSTPRPGEPAEPLPDWVLEQYAADVDLRGILQTDESGAISEPGAAVPLIGILYPAGSVDVYVNAILERIEAHDGNGPLFLAGLINAWSWTPSDVVALVEALPSDVEVLLADEFFDLFARTA
ncbi:GxGYxYP domain-containing protein [Brachybacterium sp. J144]|uniref:GxGYxYP domain-containing protein n=1 Tax=Brachybacterium sp. J144 TaxID=3116487 RepID=UPI002E77A3C3|nr:GxGYxYP domain-containing protein [Brachybacterium sp. J144]MEE1651473.1 GxGYxYP domain-containing protein [Brachybacterium sp. J144]